MVTVTSKSRGKKSQSGFGTKKIEGDFGDGKICERFWKSRGFLMSDFKNREFALSPWVPGGTRNDCVLSDGYLVEREGFF